MFPVLSSLASCVMPRLADVVRLAPNFLIGSVVSRAARLRTLESWVITRVHPSRGGGNPAVYGVRFEAALKAGDRAGEKVVAVAGAEDAEGGAGASAATATKGRRVFAAAVAAPTRIDGLLKPDWLVVRDANSAAPARKASIVRTNVGFSLSDDLIMAALRGGAPFDGVGADVARARAAVATARRGTKVAAAAAAEAEAKAAAEATGKAAKDAGAEKEAKTAAAAKSAKAKNEN